MLVYPVGFHAKRLGQGARHPARELAGMASCGKEVPMPSTDYLIGPATGEVCWHPAIGAQPRPDPPRHEPGPWPWSAAVAGLAEAARIKKIAASLPEGDLRSRLEAGASRSIDRILDQWCGTRATRPEPGSLPWSIAIAGQLAAMASSHPAGFLRDELLHIAGQALLRPFGRQQN
jgi:hypothetical protein